MITPLNYRDCLVWQCQGKRPLQEDSVKVDSQRGIFVLADGFGGHQIGQKASEVACNSVHEYIREQAGDREATLPFEIRKYFSLAGNLLFNAVMYANKRVNRLNQSKSMNESGGACLTAAFLDQEKFSVANVGSNAVWLFRDGKRKELVSPHTYGRLRDPFAVFVPEKEAIPLSALGMFPNLEPQITEIEIRKEDALLIATDGFDELVLDWVTNAWFSRVTAEEAVRTCDHYLKNCVTRDNASIIFVTFG
jgi:PPM family protein phosphatase